MAFLARFSFTLPFAFGLGCSGKRNGYAIEFMDFSMGYGLLFNVFAYAVWLLFLSFSVMLPWIWHVFSLCGVWSFLRVFRCCLWLWLCFQCLFYCFPFVFFCSSLLFLLLFSLPSCCCPLGFSIFFYVVLARFPWVCQRDWLLFPCGCLCC